MQGSKGKRRKRWSRKEVAKKLEEVAESQCAHGQRQKAEEVEVPRSTLQYWLSRKSRIDADPGIDRKTAEDMLAEMGLNMDQFPTDKHLTSWSGLAPGNHQSGGKRYSGRTRKGNQPLSAIMAQAAWSAVQTKNSFLQARYRRLAGRRGKKRALIAVARSMLVSAWHILTSTTISRPGRRLL